MLERPDLITALCTIAIVFFLLGVYLLFKNNSVAFVLMIPYTYGMFAVIISSAYLEIFRSYIFEQDSYSSANGATLLFAFYSFSAFIAIFMVVKRTGPNDLMGDAFAVQPLMNTAQLLAVVVLEVVLIAHVFASGSPLLDFSSSKFNFWEVSAKFKKLSVFNWMLYMVIFVVGARAGYFLYDNRNRLNRLLSILVLLLSILYFISWGNKFSALILVLIMYYVPACVSYYFSSGKVIRFKYRYLFIVMITIALLLIVVVRQYSVIQTRGLDVAEQIVERVFILQGHVWWGIVDRVLENGPVFAHVLDEIQAMIVGHSHAGVVGMSYLMKTLSPPSLYSGYIASNVQFTAGYPAINIISFGFILGWLVTVFSWIGFGFFLRYLCWLLQIGSYLRLFIASYIYLTAIGWLSHGSPSSFLGPKLVVFMSALLIVEMVKRAVAFSKKSKLEAVE